MCIVDENDYHLLNELVRTGQVIFNHRENQWLGKALDGKWVGLGTTKDNVASLLHDHPTPKDW